MARIPTNFNSDDVLDPGTYQATLTDLRSSILVTGNGSSDHWDSKWRLKLIDNLEILVNQLCKVGFSDIFINGSFVENKDRPNDIDGYFDANLKVINSTTLANYQQQISNLNTLDPHCCWTWDHSARKFDPATGKGQLPMWHLYRVELYPHMEGMFTGITDKTGNNLMFPSAFRQSRRKGIVQIVP